MTDLKTKTTSSVHTGPLHLAYVVMALALASVVSAPSVARAGISLVRMQGVLGAQNVPGNVGQLTLAIGDKSIPFSVLSAQKISGAPAMAPEIFSALGPGPPPIRVEGRKGMIKKLVGAPSGTRVMIVGNLNAATPLWTLMEVVVDKATGAKNKSAGAH
jgi:hypothetical protein